MIEAHFPEFFRIADTRAKKWQQFYLWTERSQLVALLVAAGTSAFSGPVSLVVISFSGAIIVHLSRLVTACDRRWWNGRAGAESAKTISWKYVTGGLPFDLGNADAENELAARITEIAKSVANLVPVAVSAGHVTPEMMLLRRSALAHRVDVYRQQRILDQIEWYAQNAAKNDRRGRSWSYATLAAQACALCLGIVGATRDWAFDFVGLLSALSASLVAWTAIKQFEFLSRSYAVASNELSSIDVRLTSTSWDESGWAIFVNDAEDAISREHTSWLASRAR